MIVIRLSGGLGNQLFQIAAALNLVDLDIEKIRVDKYNVINNGHGGYRLNYLKFPDFKSFESCWAFNMFVKIIDKFPFFSKYLFFFKHEKNITNLDFEKGYLIGYFQAVEYFNDIKPVLKNYIKPKSVNKCHLQIAEDMSKENSVFVHIRRGDYMSKEAMENHGVCSISYYEQAVLEISRKVENPKFYIFSNDINWVKNNLIHIFFEKNFEFVSGNSQEIDLWLMSNCKNAIIANSSFSWWGAYLGGEGCVISPCPWYEKKQRSSVDPALSEWIRIKK